MELIFVHGWSVTNTSTYGALPQVLSTAAAATGLQINTHDIHIGRYISFHDEVSMQDVVLAFDRALRDRLAPGGGALPAFSCITHSTGGPVLREWVRWVKTNTPQDPFPLTHLVMLAPANHGSALATLGKNAVGRIKSFFSGIEPGQRILDWLSLGSDGQWDLSLGNLNTADADPRFFRFVLTGQKIDSKLYDHINSYTGEKGSDGVVRVAGANLNYSAIKLSQTDTRVKSSGRATVLELSSHLRDSVKTCLGVLPGTSHSGTKYGIMASVKSAGSAHKPVVAEIIRCLKVNSTTSYDQAATDLAALTQATQKNDHTYSMIVFQVTDDRGERITDYDMLILGDRWYSPNALKPGFMKDKQFNKATGRLVYFVDTAKMLEMKNIGFRIIARPEKGFAYYHPAEFRSGDIPVSKIIAANETLYVDVTLKRRVARNTFDFVPVGKSGSFKRVKPIE